MSEPFLGEVRIVGFNFAPRGWAFCDGDILPISVNQALYSLLGTMYGGDGRTTFALPDLRGRAPIHEGYGGGGSYNQGQIGGAETHVLNTAEMPSHAHGATLHYPAETDTPTGLYAGDHQNTMADDAVHVDYAGASQAHENMQPFLVLNYIIALQGMFPSRN